MADVFISYARPDESHAERVAETLRAAGFHVWRDDELPANRPYAEVIEERLTSASCVIVLWSAEAARSQWVRAEADIARAAGTLVQATLDGTIPPLPFNQIQCADLFGWTGDVSWPGWSKVESSISSLAGAGSAADEPSPEPARRAAVCVLPFLNMSGDAEQEYFSDGISEDIIIDLSKVSALSVVARNMAFSFKGKPVDAVALTRQLNITHVLQGSVRKAGQRVRITAQLVDGKTGDPVWGDRYDRDLTDIFAIQDEISKAIVGALKLKLLPQEKKAIEQRGTTNTDAYNLYLMARQHWISGNDGDSRRDEVVVRICRQVVALDPNYARAWALMALAQAELRFRHDRPDEDALGSAERALALDPDLPEAHCIKARYLADEEGKPEDAIRQIEIALRLGPDSWEANKEAGRLLYRQGKMRECAVYFEKATALMETDYHASSLLKTCYHALGDMEGLRRSARTALDRIEKVVAQDPSNGAALGMGASALAALGESDRAKEWIQRAMLIAPENLTMRYNLVCALTQYLHDHAAALDLLGTFVEKMNAMLVSHTLIDPDMDALRSDPRFQKMMTDAQARLVAARAGP